MPFFQKRNQRAAGSTPFPLLPSGRGIRLCIPRPRHPFPVDLKSASSSPAASWLSELARRKSERAGCTLYDAHLNGYDLLKQLSPEDILRGLNAEDQRKLKQMLEEMDEKRAQGISDSSR
ncbi:hypothetical protein IH992_11325 [Candidatus Poribacteria bacterium]|nr:hypothetical protein [Candidatus Poribacteria bacterium]